MKEKTGAIQITVTNQSNFMLGARSFSGIPYDEHSLHSCLEQAEILSGAKAKEAFVDFGLSRCRHSRFQGRLIKDWYLVSSDLSRKLKH